MDENEDATYTMLKNKNYFLAALVRFENLGQNTDNLKQTEWSKWLSEGFLTTAAGTGSNGQAVKTTHKLFLNGMCLASQTRTRQVGTSERDDAIDREMNLLQLLGFYQCSVVAVVEDWARMGCFLKLQ